MFEYVDVERIWRDAADKHGRSAESEAQSAKKVAALIEERAPGLLIALASLSDFAPRFKFDHTKLSISAHNAPIIITNLVHNSQGTINSTPVEPTSDCYQIRVPGKNIIEIRTRNYSEKAYNGDDCVENAIRWVADKIHELGMAYAPAQSSVIRAPCEPS